MPSKDFPNNIRKMSRDHGCKTLFIVRKREEIRMKEKEKGKII